MMSGDWDISVIDSVSSPSSANNSIRFQSPIFGLRGLSPDNNSNNSSNDHNSTYSSNADLVTVRTSHADTPPTLDLTNDGWQIGLEGSLDNDNIEAEIASIRLFCESVENNLAQIGLRPGGVNSTPRIVDARHNLQINNIDQSVDLIDLSHVELSLPQSARARAPDAVIDLCTPDRTRNLPAYINLADSFEGPVRTDVRRSLNCSDYQTTSVAQAFGSNSYERVQKNESLDESYKCPVCLDSVRRREPSSTRCGHVFCRSCIEGAIQTTRKCPLCNKKMTRRSIFRIYL